MKGQKSIFDVYSNFFMYGNLFKNSSPRMTYTIKYYAISNLVKARSQNPNCLNENQKKHLEKEIIELKSLSVDPKPEIDEYIEFLQNLFLDVDKEDRHGEVTKKTSDRFKMISVLIEVLKTWGEIDSFWLEKRKLNLI